MAVSCFVPMWVSDDRPRAGLSCPALWQGRGPGLPWSRAGDTMSPCRPWSVVYVQYIYLGRPVSHRRELVSWLGSLTRF